MPVLVTQRLESWFTGPRLLTLGIAAALAWSLSRVDWQQPIAHTGGGAAALKVLLALFPPELSPEFLRICVVASWHTLAYAVAAMSLAVAIGLPLGVLASGVLAGAGNSARPRRWALMGSVRFVLAAMRSVHELVWALLFVAAVGLSPMAAILAMSIPYAGILGRIYAELLQDVPPEPVAALKSTGASPLRVLLYGYLPMALPDLLSYTFYRLECGIRAAAIMSFVGIDGIGFQIELSLADLLFRQVWTLLIFLVILVVAVDWWSGRVRRSLAD